MSEALRFERVLVSPEMAQLWLDGRATNRRMRMAHVRELAMEISAGRWRETHQGIAFDPSGALVDGQHRMAAVVMADRCIHITVAYYRETPPLLQIDGISPKSVTDRLVLSGRADLTSGHVAVTRAFWSGGFSTQDSKAMTTDAATERLLCRFWDAIVFGSGVTTTRTRGVGSAIVGGALSRAWLYEDHQRLSEFLVVLKTGLPVSVIDDQSAIALREQLIASTSVNGRFRREVFLKTQRAIKAFCDREPLKLVRAPEKDIYPRPDFDPYSESH